MDWYKDEWCLMPIAQQSQVMNGCWYLASLGQQTPQPGASLRHTLVLHF